MSVYHGSRYIPRADAESPDADADADADTPSVSASMLGEDETSQDDPSSQTAPPESGNNPTPGNNTNSPKPLNSNNNSNTILSVPTLDSVNHLRSVGHTNAVVCWELSSAKPGNGVEQLRDASTETYWQSDGTTQPHWIQLTFARRLRILYVALYLDFQLDESYTPRTISIETGMTTQDLDAAPENRAMELHDPVGWCIFPVITEAKTHVLRLSILSMHQNGRDTHVRSVAVFAAPMRVSMVDHHHHNRARATRMAAAADENSNTTTTAEENDPEEEEEETTATAAATTAFKEMHHQQTQSMQLSQPVFESNPFSFQIR